MTFYRPPTIQGTIDALGTVCRAVRAWKFYPKGHPTRRSRLTLAHATMLRLLDGNTLSLACGRTGFSYPDGEFLKDTSGLSASLAYELFIRRVQKITFLFDLFQEDLLELFKILCISPEAIQIAGGIDAIMTERGIRSIFVNEFDLTAIRGKRQQIEQAGNFPQGIDEAEKGTDDAMLAFDQQPPPTDELTPEHKLSELIARLTSCIDDDIYLMLTRQAVACADTIQSRHDPRMLFPLIDLFAAHADDQVRSESIREYAQFAIEQIISTGEVLQLVLEQSGQEQGVSQIALYAVLKVGGASAVSAAINLMGQTGSLKTRKILSTAVASLGEAAVPALLNLMHDMRWYIIRNICAILGVIASKESIAALSKCLHHQDLRVRKEAIRSLAKVGGYDAEVAILSIFRGADTLLYPQAIASLGGMKSKRSLIELLKIINAKDLFLKTLQLKIDALTAIAVIGDRQTVPRLITLLEERHLLAAARGRQLKTAVAVCLGKLGDPKALPALNKLSSAGGELGSACLDAIAMIEKAEGRQDEIT